MFSGAERLCNFSRGNYEERFCQIILNLDQLFRGRCLKYLVLALVAISFSGAEPFVKFGQVVKEKRCRLKVFLF